MPDHIPEVLFVCVHNAGRSQMAAALLDHHAKGRVIVRSAGTAPADTINPAVVAAMAEVGIDLLAAGATPKSLTEAAVQAVRRRHHHGLRRHLPLLPRRPLRRLGARRPGGQSARRDPPIRDQIDRCVLELLDDLTTRKERHDYRHQLTMAQRNLVNTATSRLKDEFAGIFAAETIERFIADSLDQPARCAGDHVRADLRRAVHPRPPQALAKVEGKIEPRCPVRAVPLRPQRRPLPDGCGLAEAPGRRAGRGLLRWLDAGQ